MHTSFAQGVHVIVHTRTWTSYMQPSTSCVCAVDIFSIIQTLADTKIHRSWAVRGCKRARGVLPAESVHKDEQSLCLRHAVRTFVICTAHAISPSRCLQAAAAAQSFCRAVLNCGACAPSRHRVSAGPIRVRLMVRRLVGCQRE